MQQCFLGVLNCSWEQQDGESVPAAGQCLGVGSGSGAWAWGSSQPLTSSAFLGTQEMSWCLRRDSFSLISPHSAPSLLHTFFVFCLVAPLEIPSPPPAPPGDEQLPLQWASPCDDCRACSEHLRYSPSLHLFRNLKPISSYSLLNEKGYSFKSKLWTWSNVNSSFYSLSVCCVPAITHLGTIKLRLRQVCLQLYFAYDSPWDLVKMQTLASRSGMESEILCCWQAPRCCRRY